MKYINTHCLNGVDTVVSTQDNGQDIGIISKFKGSYCFYPFSIGRYINQPELKEILNLISGLNKNVSQIPALLKKDS